MNLPPHTELASIKVCPFYRRFRNNSAARRISPKFVLREGWEFKSPGTRWLPLRTSHSLTYIGQIPLGSSRLDTTRHVWRVERVETWRDEPSGRWVYRNVKLPTCTHLRCTILRNRYTRGVSKFKNRPPNVFQRPLNRRSTSVQYLLIAHTLNITGDVACWVYCKLLGLP